MKTKGMKIFGIMMALLALNVGTVFAKGNKNDSGSAKLKIVATIFPEYDWVREILGDKADDVELTLLLNNGVDLHSYQPTVADITRVSSADIFIYVGGESDKWVADVLKTAKNKNIVAINLLETLGETVKEEEVVEGMQAEEEEEDGEEEEVEYDEHVWLSLRNAKALCTAIAQVICEKDSANAAFYKANLNTYITKLDDLDAQYTAAVNEAKRKAVVFGDRFPLRYLVDDYGITYYAAFVGCSAETEASFQTITFLAKKVDELNLNYVLKIEKSKDNIARTVIQNSGNKKAKILMMDSMQSTTSRDIKKGATYLGIMTSNLEVLKTALNG